MVLIRPIPLATTYLRGRGVNLVSTNERPQRIQIGHRVIPGTRLVRHGRHAIAHAGAPLRSRTLTVMKFFLSRILSYAHAVGALEEGAHNVPTLSDNDNKENVENSHVQRKSAQCLGDIECLKCRFARSAALRWLSLTRKVRFSFPTCPCLVGRRQDCTVLALRWWPACR